MRIKIQVLGSGCRKCRMLEKLTTEVARENNMNAEILKVEDIVQIIKYGVMSTPALVVNGKVVITGRVPSKTEIKSLIDKEISEISDQN